MHLTINPKDSNTFASASLDRTVKVWTLNPTSNNRNSSSRIEPNYTLEAHEKGVNYVEFYQGNDRPYMVTTGDDRTVKIWDYLNKSCVQTLHGHTSNVSFAVFHPHLPLIISGAEDGSVRLWHSGTYRLERTLEYGLERAWCLAYRRNEVGGSLNNGAGINDVALGYDEGTVVIKLGKEDPTVSMDHSGKVVWTRNNEVRTANVGMGREGEDAPTIADGTRLPLSIRELGTTDVYAQSLSHSPNGRFITVLGDGEYVIYTALAWRNKAFGSGLSFAWSSDSNTYAVRESGGRVRIFKNFKERVGLVNPGWKVEDTKSGALLGLVGNGFVCFHDWESGSLIRRIDVDVKNIYWSQSGTLVAIQTPDSFYILRFDRDAYNAYLESGEPVEDDGVEDAFELITEVAETVKTAKWTGECFIYTNSLNRLQYLVGEQVSTVAHTDIELYLLGYMPPHGRVYLVDKDMSVFSYSLSLAVVDYQTAILRGDLDEASQILTGVPPEQRNKIARFLESQDLQQLALSVSTDSDHKFDLAISLDDFDTALEIARSGPQAGSESRWRTIGDKALERWNITLAKECFQKAGDLSALLLIGTSNNDVGLLNELIELSIEKGSTNIAFAAILQLGQRNRAIDLLLKTNRIPEAALFARTYKPERVSEIVKLWKMDLESTKRSKQNAIAKSIADPQFDSQVFEEGWENALKISSEIKEHHAESLGVVQGKSQNGKATKGEIVGAEIEKMSGTKDNGAQG